MNQTHPNAPMQTKNYQKELSAFFIGSKPISNTDSPKEDISSSMTTTTIPKKMIWRPNNYRRKIEVKKKTNSGTGAILKKHSTIDTTYARHTKIISIKNFMPNITIQYGKKTLTAIYSQTIIGGHKETFLISRKSIKEINSVIDNKSKSIKKRMDIALNKFISQFNLRVAFKRPKWDRYEDFLKGEEYIDKIPRETIIHDTVFKKVYGKGIEFKNTGKGEKPTAHLKNYIVTRAVEDISPLIAQEINHFNNSTGKVLGQFTNQLGLHLSVLKGIDKSFRKFNKLLSKQEQKRINEFK